MLKKAFSCFAILLVAGATVIAADVDLKGVKCVVAPRDAKASQSAEYRDASVYFCCGNCAGKFAADSEPFSTKANHQLVATKQFEQKACPFSGGGLDEDTAIKVAGVEVAFCCNNCKGKAEAAEGDKQIEMIFVNKAFEKGFAKVEKKDAE